MNAIRLLPLASFDGPTNMAADEVLLEAAVAGRASLRFYTWSEATLSLGYFQPAAVQHSDPRLKELPCVRRTSGGGALVHHHELTYALALPAGATWQPRGQSWICRMHGVVAKALGQLGLSAMPQPCNAERRLHDVLCFLHHTPGDLIVEGHKVVGSAQRKQRGALLQHGAILLAHSAHAPQLPGLRELAGTMLDAEVVSAAVLPALLTETGWIAETANWSSAERARMRALRNEKYASDAWNLKR